MLNKLTNLYGKIISMARRKCAIDELSNLVISDNAANIILVYN